MRMRVPAVDLHVDTLSRLLEAGGDLSRERPDLQVDLLRCRAGLVRLLLTACYTSDAAAEATAHVSMMLDLAERMHGDPGIPLVRVGSPRELQSLPDGTVGVLPTIENGRSLGGDLERLREWYRRGVRIFGLTWNAANDLAAGVLAEVDSGLTATGREVVVEAARLGMAIDLSHLAPVGFAQVLAQDVPVLATHSNARAVHDHPRNLSDEQLRALGRAGGIVGLNFYPPFLGESPVDLSTVARHAAHIADVIGADRVALGTDLDGVDALPDGFLGHQSLPALEVALAGVGFEAEERQGIFSNNFLGWWQGWAQQS